MTSKRQQPEILEKDYEDSSHTQKKKKAAIKQASIKKTRQELYDTCGFDDEDDAQQYERFLK